MEGEKGNNAISIFHSDGARDTFKHVYMRDKSHLLAVLTAVSSASPIDKIITMIGDLESKIIKEGEGAHKVYAEFAAWCEDTSKDVMYEIRTGNGNVADLKATISLQLLRVWILSSHHQCVVFFYTRIRVSSSPPVIW